MSTNTQRPPDDRADDRAARHREADAAPGRSYRSPGPGVSATPVVPVTRAGRTGPHAGAVAGRRAPSSSTPSGPDPHRPRTDPHWPRTGPAPTRTRPTQGRVPYGYGYGYGLVVCRAISSSTSSGSRPGVGSLKAVIAKRKTT